jgi:hypothetical protein
MLCKAERPCCHAGIIFYFIYSKHLGVYYNDFFLNVKSSVKAIFREPFAVSLHHLGLDFMALLFQIPYSSAEPKATEYVQRFERGYRRVL